MSALESGTMLGVYRIEHFLGSGSMGEVFCALDTGLARQVAVKILSARHRDNAELRARFVREGRAVAAISHPHVVAVFATGLHDELPYIVMELLQGVDLGSYVEQQGPLAPAAAAAVVRDAAMGLLAASQAGIIHRDVKPSNLVRLANGTVKVTDFGLAKPKDPKREPALTGMGVVVGTPDYIAPEQARGELLDERCDIYALGGTLFFLLTGRPPFRTGVASEDKYLKVVARHLRDPAPDPRQYAPDVPAELAMLCRQLMSKAPDERPTYDALITQLGGMMTHYAGVPAAKPGGQSSDAWRRAEPQARGSSDQGGDANWGSGSANGDLSDSSGAAQGASYGSKSASGSMSAMSDDSLFGMLPAPWPRWVWPLTALAVGVFVAGLLAYTSRAKHVAASDHVSDSAVITMANKRVAVDIAPVGAKAFAAVVTDGNPQSAQAASDAPVTGITYTQARAYAEAVGKRLATADELVAAAALIAPPPAPLWEWVQSTTDQRTISRGLVTKQVADTMRTDTTFRLAQDLAATP